jgi:hypothetical protein
MEGLVQDRTYWDRRREERLAEQRRTWDEEQERWLRTPFYSVASVGTGRWAWVTWTGHEGWLNGEPPTAHGVCPSEAQAVAEAQHHTGQGADRDRAYVATNWQRHLARERRASRPSKGNEEAVRTTLVWSHSFFDWGEGWTPYRVLKVTRTRVYVDRRIFHPDGSAGDGWDVRTFTLDRAALEREGYAYRRHQGGYYSEAGKAAVEARGANNHRPDCARVLGLAWPCGEAEIRRAYRRQARELHPDAGGDAEAFKALQAAYEQALVLVAVPA